MQGIHALVHGRNLRHVRAQGRRTASLVRSTPAGGCTSPLTSIVSTEYTRCVRRSSLRGCTRYLWAVSGSWVVRGDGRLLRPVRRSFPSSVCRRYHQLSRLFPDGEHITGNARCRLLAVNSMTIRILNQSRRLCSRSSILRQLVHSISTCLDRRALLSRSSIIAVG